MDRPTDPNRAARATRALERTLNNFKRLDHAGEKLNTALDGASNGVPIKPIDPEDSLAASIDGAREGAGTTLLSTERSRRAMRAKTGG